eukprot:1515002-Karenia_brevis.AAC.1
MDGVPESHEGLSLQMHVSSSHGFRESNSKVGTTCDSDRLPSPPPLQNRGSQHSMHNLLTVATHNVTTLRPREENLSYN